MKYQDFSFCQKIIPSSRAEKILFFFFTCEDIGVAIVTNLISQLQESFPLRRAAGSRCKDDTVAGDLLDELPNFHIAKNEVKSLEVDPKRKKRRLIIESDSSQESTT